MTSPAPLRQAGDDLGGQPADAGHVTTAEMLAFVDMALDCAAKPNWAVAFDGPGDTALLLAIRSIIESAALPVPSPGKEGVGAGSLNLPGDPASFLDAGHDR